MEIEYLPAKLRANGTACPGDENGLAEYGGKQELRIRRHGIAAEQVLDGHVGNVVDAGLAGDEFADARYRLDVHRVFREPFEYVTTSAPRRTGHCQQHTFDRLRPYDARYVGRVVDLEALDALAD